jgi:hypothetical protein
MKRPFAWILAIYAVLAVGRVLTNNPWCDEGWFFDPVYNWITKGFAGTTILEATGFPWQGIERHQYWQPPMHLLIHGLWLRIFPLTLFSFRSCSLFAGFICLFLWRSLFRYIGLPGAIQNLSLLLVAVDYAYLRAASDGRTDMLAETLGLGAVIAYLHFRETNFTLAVFLSQLLAVCGGLTHPMGGLIYLAALAFFFLRNQDWRRLRWFHPLLAAVPYLLGAAGWGAYIMQEPETFKKIFLGSSVAGRMNGIFHPLASLQREFVLRYLTPYGWTSTSTVLRIKTIIPFFYFAGVVTAFLVPQIRQMRHMRLLFSLWGVTFLVLFVFDGQRNGTYLGHIFPYCAAILASVIYYLWNSTPPFRALGAAVLAAMLLLQASGSIYIIATNPYRNQYLPAVEFVKSHTKPGSYVAASTEFGFGFGFDSMRDDMTLGFYNHRKPDAVIVETRYRNWFDDVTLSQWPAWQFSANRFRTEYQESFQNGKYEIYLPKP